MELKTASTARGGAVFALALSGLFAVASGCTGAPPDAAQAKPEKGKALAVGDKAPAFALKDQAGTERSLDDLRKRGPVALVFYRSAKW
jgi:cytochrome oxidase Cu insertion factor (SCO1/SenC/PrrC family)